MTPELEEDKVAQSQTGICSGELSCSLCQIPGTALRPNIWPKTSTVQQWRGVFEVESFCGLFGGFLIEKQSK